MIAADTEGLSGADLQAVVYNAHLEVVQASIADMQASETTAEPKGKGKGKAVNGKGKAKPSDDGVNDRSKKVSSKGWKQLAPEGAAEMPGLSARVSCSTLQPQS